MQLAEIRSKRFPVSQTGGKSLAGLLGLSKLSGLVFKRSRNGLADLSRSLGLMLKKGLAGVCAVALVAAALYGFGLSGAVHGQTPQPTPQPTPQVVNQYPPPQINNVSTAHSSRLNRKRRPHSASNWHEENI